jgi:F-type H+-transporting ATPase subunit delta
MRGASAESVDALLEELGGAVSGGADGYRLAEDLFAVSRLMAEQPGLRRVLTDLSVSGDRKAALARQILSGRVEPPAVEVVASAATRRWAATRDLGDALEVLGVAAVVKQADREGQGDALEDELFGFGRLVSENPELRDALSDPARSTADKHGLLRGLLEGRVTRGTLLLAQQAVSGSHRTVAVAVEEYQRLAAAERERLVALVRTARPLGERDAGRLTAALSRQYGRPVHLNEVVDPDVLGGLRVEVGDDVIDGTVASRLEDARRRLAG